MTRKIVPDLTIAKKLVAIEISASSRNIEFNLSFKRMKQLMTQKTCYYSGETLVDGIQCASQRTIERVNNNLGYIDSNVVAVTQKYNSVKSNHADIMFINIVNGIKKHQRKSLKTT